LFKFKKLEMLSKSKKILSKPKRNSIKFETKYKIIKLLDKTLWFNKFWYGLKL